MALDKIVVNNFVCADSPVISQTKSEVTQSSTSPFLSYTIGGAFVGAFIGIASSSSLLETSVYSALSTAAGLLLAYKQTYQMPVESSSVCFSRRLYEEITTGIANGEYKATNRQSTRVVDSNKAA